MQRDASLSRFLAGGLIPICVFGLISTLLLHLVEIRSLFVTGGETRLRQAMLFFAMGVILAQRLRPEEGVATSRNYLIALGATITLFAAYHATAFQFGVHPSIVFLVNEVLFGILMWVGVTITEACSVDTDAGQAASAVSGILYGTAGRQKLAADEEPVDEAEEDEKWAERLPSRHPGRVILYFSLFAVPAFGLGVFLFDPDDPVARVRMGALLFIYLFCAFALLALSSLRQLGAYFEKRDVELPEMVGLTWMSIAFISIAVVLTLAVFLPQPASISNAFVRHSIMSSYHGWSSSRGIKDPGVQSGKGTGGEKNGDGGKGASRKTGRRSSAERVTEGLKERYKPYDELGDPVLKDAAINYGFERDHRMVLAFMAATDDAFVHVFNELLKLIFYVVLPICALMALYALVTSAGKGFSFHLGGRRWARKPKSRKKAKDAEEEDREREKIKTERYEDVPNPFSMPYGPSDGDALVRQCWRAMVAYCADYGTPCPPDRTPFEFVESRPPALRGFEENARFIADLFTMSEFSNRTLTESERSDLQDFWNALRNFAGSRLEA